MPHILLIEDDPRIRSIVEHGLGARGLVVTLSHDGPSGLEAVRKLEVDLVLLDLVLPGKGGLQVLAELRSLRARLPVIALTALDDAGSKVNGLDAGADDYVTKPFSMDELAARIRARLRFREEASTALKAGPLTVDLLTHRAMLDGREVDLSSRELTLLATFVRHTGMVLSRRQLLHMVWEIDFDPNSNVVEVYVAALRRKIGPTFLETVRGRGYRFVLPDPTNDTERATGGAVGCAADSATDDAIEHPPREAKR